MPSPHPLSLHVETKTQSTVVGVGCLPLPSSHHAPGASRSSPRSSLRLSARPACLPHTPMRSSSAHPLVSPSAACFLLVGSSARPLPRIARLPAPSTSRTGRRGAISGRRRRAVIGDVRMAASGWRRLLACLGSMDGAARSFLFSSHRLIQLARPRFLSSSHRPISSTWRGILFPFRLTPSRLLFSVCLLWLVPPSPAGGCAGCGMAYGGGRGDCLLAFSSPHVALSLPLVRSLLYALRRSCRSFLPGASLGVLWAFLTAILSALAFLKTCP